MGAAQFDRQAFLQPKEGPPRNPMAMIGPLLLAAVVIVGGLAFYKFVIADSTPDGSTSNNAELTQVEQRLKAVEQRLDQLDKKRKSTGTEMPPPEAKDQNAVQKDHTPPVQPVPRTVYRVSPSPSSVLHASQPSGVAREPQAANQKKEINSLQRDVTASREEWEATTNRLGSVVGELGSQRSDIENSKDTLNQLVDRFQRQDYTFTLQRRSGRQRVGPVALWLQNADARSGRYTLRILVNDKWVEFKDRALHEALEFYPSGSPAPIELVISHMNKDQVVGKIAVPQDLGSH
jgi:septal ring factor EnvC (AmiA/AmiB activator)